MLVHQTEITDKALNQYSLYKVASPDRKYIMTDSHDSGTKPVQNFKTLDDSRKSDLASMTDRLIAIKRKPWLYIGFERILRNRGHHMEFLFHYHHSSAVERFEMSELKTQYIRIVSVHICLMRHLACEISTALNQC